MRWSFISDQNGKIKHHINEKKIHKPKPCDFGLKCDVKFTYVVTHDLLV